MWEIFVLLMFRHCYSVTRSPILCESFFVFFVCRHCDSVICIGMLFEIFLLLIFLHCDSVICSPVLCECFLYCPCFFTVMQLYM